MEPNEVRPAKAAEITGYAEQTLANLRSTGKGPAYLKRGRMVFYRVSELERWMASQVTEEHPGERPLRLVAGARLRAADEV